MTETHEPLILDLVAWVAERPRPYAEVMDAWRTSCPRLPVWEDAVDRGLVRRIARHGSGPVVEATAAGLAKLCAAGRLPRSLVSRPPRPAC
jgi:hypothetical protein